jgi:hypothetical protein
MHLLQHLALSQKTLAGVNTVLIASQSNRRLSRIRREAWIVDGQECCSARAGGTSVLYAKQPRRVQTWYHLLEGRAIAKLILADGEEALENIFIPKPSSARDRYSERRSREPTIERPRASPAIDDDGFSTFNVCTSDAAS